MYKNMYGYVYICVYAFPNVRVCVCTSLLFIATALFCQAFFLH